MLATQSSLKCCLNGDFNKVTNSQKDETNNCDKTIVLNLGDNESNKLLESMTKAKTKSPISNSMSVELWIKSLNECTDDQSKSDPNSCTDSCSDQDDLRLGDEATDLLQRKRKSTKGDDTSQSDSEESRSYSITRSHIFKRLRSQGRSIDSDISGRSSATSLSSLLSVRESDPEDVLKNLGFGGAHIIDNIPDRFIAAGTKCQGIDAEVFLSSIQDDETNKTNDIPPWVAARVEDIPKKFLPCSDMSQLTNTGQSVCLVPESPVADENENALNETYGSTGCNTRSGAPTLSSKFGTYLEPVSEEMEVSSQGSVNLNVCSINDRSFESNRSSTLKADSREEPYDQGNRVLSLGNKIPSLRDLWSTTDDESQIDFISTKDGSDSVDVVNNDEEEHDPVLVSSCQTDKHSYMMYDNTQVVATPADEMESHEKIPGLMDYFQDNKTGRSSPVSFEYDDLRVDTDTPAHNAARFLPESQQTAPLETTDSNSTTENKQKECISGLMSYLSGESNSPPMDNAALASDSKELNSNATDFSEYETVFPDAESPNLVQNSKSHRNPLKNIPSIIISTLKEPTRKISTVDAPDLKRLQPDVAEEQLNSEENDQKTAEKLTSHKNNPQYTFIGGKWVCLKRRTRPQIHITIKSEQKSAENSQENSSKVLRKVTIVKRSRFPQQLSFPGNKCKLSIPCFSDFKSVPLYKTKHPSLAVCQRSSGFGSSATPSNSNSSSPENVPTTASTTRFDNFQDDIQRKLEEGKGTLFFEEQSEKYFGKPVGSEGMLRHGASIDDELDNLHSSLKSIKIYKAGVHLMQLASSVETVIGANTQPVRSCQVLLDAIQKELKDSEKYILHVQKRLSNLQKSRKTENLGEDKGRWKSDFPEITTQLLREQLKMFNSIANSVSPSSTPSRKVSTDDDTSLVSTSELSGLRNEMTKLRKEMEITREENENRYSTMKKEILSEVKMEIRSCFREFTQR